MTSPATAIHLDSMLCFALYSATHAMQHVYKPLLEGLGLTYPQYLVLITLWQQDGQTVGQLGAALQLESNTLTPLLKRMETAGLLTRARDTGDERQVRLTLTGRGRALQARAEAIPACLLERSGLTLEALADLQHRIAGLRDHLRQP
ncbi:MAG TPA: MarR family transcriptional regulator [Paracoccaceae bacterium]